MNSRSIQTNPDGLEVLIGTGQPYNEPFVGNQQDVLEIRTRFQRDEMGLLEPLSGAEMDC